MFERIWWEAISKKKRGIGDFFIFLFLLIVSLFYYFGLLFRRLFYAAGIFKAKIFNPKIISVGNITMGGRVRHLLSRSSRKG